MATTPSMSPELFDFRMGSGLKRLYRNGFLVEPVPGILDRIGAFFGVPETEVRFPDLSHWNKKPSWAKLRDEDGISTIMFRSTYGPSGKDKVFPVWVPEAVGEGITPIIYHFANHAYDGGTQADNCWEQVEPIADILGFVPVVIWDSETIDGVSNTMRWVRQFEFYNRMVVHGSRQEKLGPYTSPGFANTYLSPMDSRVNDHPQHIAHWWNGKATPPVGWTNVVMQQRGIYNDHSWIAPVTGIEPDVDVNFWYGDQASFSAFTGQIAPPPPPPPPPPSGDIIPLKEVIVTASALNVRSKADVGGNDIGTLVGGSQVPVVGVSGKWLRIDGWIHGDYTKDV